MNYKCPIKPQNTHPYFVAAASIYNTPIAAAVDSRCDMSKSMTIALFQKDHNPPTQKGKRRVVPCVCEYACMGDKGIGVLK
jgi:hypothetical protein